MKPPFPIGTIQNFFPKTPNYFLSNFSPATITCLNFTFSDLEHAYQAYKSDDPLIHRLIYECPTPQASKKQGGSIKLRDNWDTIKFDVMRELLKKKFAPGSILEQKLFQTGNVLLIEGNYWHDLTWGQCFCQKHNWEGDNWLGNLLMERRSFIDPENFV